MTRFNRLTILLIIFLALTSSWAISAANITGLVKDLDSKEPLLEASVRILASKDSSLVAGTTTDIDGKFSIKGIKAGKYILSIGYIGYADLEKPISVTSSNLRLGTLYLKESSQLLGEVTVVAVKTPIKVMEDTVEYNADSYHTQPNAVVEDLLKRLPGVEVETDGSITANGKTVSKILIDGKEFDKNEDGVVMNPHRVVPGFGEGLSMMKNGSSYVLYIPGKLAYGVDGNPQAGIGPNAMLVFEVETSDVTPAK